MRDSIEVAEVRIYERTLYGKNQYIQGYKWRETLDLKKKEAVQVKVDLIRAGFSKLQDLEKAKDHLKDLIGSVISFNNV